MSGLWVRSCSRHQIWYWLASVLVSNLNGLSDAVRHLWRVQHRQLLMLSIQGALSLWQGYGYPVVFLILLVCNSKFIGLRCTLMGVIRTIPIGAV